MRQVSWASGGTNVAHRVRCRCQPNLDVRAEHDIWHKKYESFKSFSLFYEAFKSRMYIASHSLRMFGCMTHEVSSDAVTNREVDYQRENCLVCLNVYEIKMMREA